MSNTWMNRLFQFGSPLPPPFDALKSKKVKVHSRHSAIAEATLSSSVIKAIHAVCRCMDGSGEGAVGVIDHRMVAEYKSSSGPDDFHLVVYDSSTGTMMASVYHKNTEIMETYAMNGGRDGTALFMVMFPKLMEDEEFKENFEAYYKDYSGGFPDMAESTEHMAMLCDNAYRRVKDDSLAEHVKVNLDNSGNLMRVSQAQLDSGVFTPVSVTAGEFQIFARTGRAAPLKAAAKIIELSDFEGKFALHPRVFSQTEERLIPKLPEWYIIPQSVVDICRHAQLATGKPTQMRNFMLRGPAGTGKTMGAKAIAAGLGLPYMKYTCSAGSEVFDFIGQVLPCFDEPSTGDEQLDVERAQLKEMGGINYENVAKLMKLPGIDDMDYDPSGVYRALTGEEKPDATSQDCMKVVLQLVTEKVRELSRTKDEKNSGPVYTYEETDFIRALKQGNLIEVQEPTVILQPGVMVGLNSLLEQGGSITLPTGQVIKRHPDSIVVVTTNVDYEGCRTLNQSLVDRMSLVMDIELPSPEVMMQRAMAVTGATDEYQVSQMVQVVCDMADYCRKNHITDGNVGMRSLLDWIISTEVTGDVYESALTTIVSKATSDEIDREALITTVLEPTFAPKANRVSVS